MSSAAMATLKFSATLSKSDPQTNAVLIVGQTKHLTQISWEIIKGKLEPRVDCEVIFLCSQ